MLKREFRRISGRIEATLAKVPRLRFVALRLAGALTTRAYVARERVMSADVVEVNAIVVCIAAVWRSLSRNCPAATPAEYDFAFHPPVDFDTTKSFQLIMEHLAALQTFRFNELGLASKRDCCEVGVPNAC